jgi:hypothetical protein
VKAKRSAPPPALFDLAHHRKAILALAQDTKQDGHTLSVLREAEKDARRASLPLRNRERILLELWRWLLGYGERIVWPLAMALPLLFILGIAEVGWAKIWSKSWWGGFGSIARYESIMNFSLPGVDFLGLSGTGGVWGVLAKAVSVVFVASALSAAVRVVRRGE